MPERVPEDRYRHAIHAGVRGFVVPTETAWTLGYRFYADDWDIMAHTPEVQAIQRVTGDLHVRGRYRYHTQSEAFFYQDIYTRQEIEDSMRFVTEDEKLGALSTHLAGVKVSTALALFGVTGDLAGTVVDVSLEHLWQSTSFGNAWIGQLGVAIPWEY